MARTRRTAAQIVADAEKEERLKNEQQGQAPTKSLEEKEAKEIPPEAPEAPEQVVAAPAQKKKEIITIMDRQAPFLVLGMKAGRVMGAEAGPDKDGQVHVARYKQYGALFNCGGILLPNQKIKEPELPSNVRIIGRM